MGRRARISRRRTRAGKRGGAPSARPPETQLERAFEFFASRSGQGCTMGVRGAYESM
ncbi:hypothetical protein OH687_24895 [Burkholderia anthina]|nr:hypothetical protein OH687_24895 [Burkholderia anthina]